MLDHNSQRYSQILHLPYHYLPLMTAAVPPGSTWVCFTVFTGLNNTVSTRLTISSSMQVGMALATHQPQVAKPELLAIPGDATSGPKSVMFPAQAHSAMELQFGATAAKLAAATQLSNHHKSCSGSPVALSCAHDCAKFADCSPRWQVKFESEIAGPCHRREAAWPGL